jgi:radical SAM-linked protein
MPARVPEGPPPAPVVQRLRVHFARRGPLRFSSHRDFQRAFERALRRADVPTAFSAGFTPHPKVSYAGAAPTGAASEAEYLEVGLAARRDPQRVRADLDASLPPGLDVLEVVEAAAGSSLVDRLEASVYEIALPGVDAATAGAAVDRFLAADRVEVERTTKSGLRRFDAREAVIRLTLSHEAGDPRVLPGWDEFGTDPCAILRVVVRHSTPAVRPDDVLAALRSVADLAPPVPPLVTRLAQGPLDAGAEGVSDPLAPDRA